MQDNLGEDVMHMVEQRTERAHDQNEVPVLVRPPQRYFMWFHGLIGAAVCAILMMFGLWFLGYAAPDIPLWQTAVPTVVRTTCWVVVAGVVIIMAIHTQRVIELENYALNLIANALRDYRLHLEDEQAPNGDT